MSLVETPAKTISGGTSGLKSSVGGLTNALRNPFTRSTDKSHFPVVDYPEGFLISEVVDDPNQGQQIVLVGNMMPKNTFDRDVTVRAQKDNYPGNDYPVVHVLGADEDDITIKGRLYDKRYADKKFRGVANEIREAMEEMAKRKNLVRISLGEWRRYAIMSKVKSSEKTLADIDYEITFIILGTKAPKNYQLIDRLEDIPIDVNNELIAAAADYARKYSSAPDSVPASISDILNGVTSSVAGVLKIATDFVDGVVSVGEEITGSIGRAVGLMRYSRGTIAGYKRRLASISYSLDFNKMKVPARYKASAFIGGQMSDMNSLQSILSELIKRFEALSKTVPKARHRVINGDTLQKLSTKFYGTPEHWKAIYDHNKLTDTDLVAGKILEIPKV